MANHLLSKHNVSLDDHCIDFPNAAAAAAGKRRRPDVNQPGDVLTDGKGTLQIAQLLMTPGDGLQFLPLQRQLRGCGAVQDLLVTGCAHHLAPSRYQC